MMTRWLHGDGDRKTLRFLPFSILYSKETSRRMCNFFSFLFSFLLFFSILVTVRPDIFCLASRKRSVSARTVVFFLYGIILFRSLLASTPDRSCASRESLKRTTSENRVEYLFRRVYGRCREVFLCQKTRAVRPSHASRIRDPIRDNDVPYIRRPLIRRIFYRDFERTIKRESM